MQKLSVFLLAFLLVGAPLLRCQAQPLSPTPHVYSCHSQAPNPTENGCQELCAGTLGHFVTAATSPVPMALFLFFAVCLWVAALPVALPALAYLPHKPPPNSPIRLRSQLVL